MTTDDFTTAARAEAETQSEAAAAIVKPKKTDIAFARGVKAGVLHGAEWARTYLAEQEPTDDAVCDLIEDRMCDATLTACVQEPDGEMTTYVDAPLDEVIRVVRDALAAARAEAERLTPEGTSVPVLRTERDNLVHMAEWARDHLAAQEPTDAEVEAASRTWAESGPTTAVWEQMIEERREYTRERMRACLSAARAAARAVRTAR